MFALPSIARPPGLGRPRGTAPAHCRGPQPAGAILRLALLILPLAAASPDVVSAQALGTMQVTARVLPGGAPWAGLLEANDWAERVQRSPFSGSAIRRAGLVQVRADLASAAGQRRLLITVDYPRN